MEDECSLSDADFVCSVGNETRYVEPNALRLVERTVDNPRFIWHMAWV
jgi:hypothetical protein